MKLNKLLKRQMEKYFPEAMDQMEQPGKMKHFLKAINDSYNAYERDHELADRAFRLSEEEYMALNGQLKKEVDLNKLSITRLKESVRALGAENIREESDDFIDILQILDTEISLRKQTQQELQETATKLTNLINNLHTGVIVVDMEGNISRVNQYLCKLIMPETNAVDLMGRSFNEIITTFRHLMSEPDDLATRFRQLTSLKKIHQSEAIALQDGRFLEFDYIPLLVEQSCTGHLLKFRDITSRKNEQAALEASEKRWHFALEGAGDGVWEYNFNTMEIFFSSQYKKMLGYEDHEFPNEVNQWWDRIHPEDQLLVKQNDADYFTGKSKSHQIEYRLLHRSGKYIWILDRGMIMDYTSDGRPNRIIGTHSDITSRKNTEDQLRRLSLVASANDNAVLFADSQGCISWINDGFTRITGYEMPEICGKTLAQLLMDKLTDEMVINDIRHHINNQTGFTSETILFTKKGDYFWARISGQYLMGGDDNSGQYFGIIENINAEKEREKQIELLSLVASTNAAGVLIFDSNETIAWCNPSFEKITQFTMDELKGRNAQSFQLASQTSTDARDRILFGLNNRCDFNEEACFFRKDGTTFWARIRMQFILDEYGNLRQEFALIEDISEAVMAKAKLQEAESRFRTAIEQVGDNVWEYDMETKTTQFAGQNGGLLGLPDSNFNGHTDKWWSRVFEEDKPLLRDSEKRYIDQRQDSHSLEYRIRCDDGSLRWVLDRGIVIEKNQNGYPLRLMGTHSDITDRKLSEQALKINEEKYRNIIANMNLGLLEVDTNEYIQFANNSFCEMSGYELEELQEKKASTLFAKGESLELLEQKNELRQSGLSDAYQIAVKNKRGELRWWLISAAPRFNDLGELVGSIGIHLDITEQKKLEGDLLSAREAAEFSAKAKEQFLANMSHEIRTPMNAILGMGKQLAKSPLDIQQRSFLEAMNKSAEHLLVVINDILDISKIDAGKLELEHIGFKIEDLIDHTLSMMKTRAGEKGLYLLNESVIEHETVLLGDPVRIQQVLLNLLSNSIKFTEKGEVVLSAGILPGDNGKMQVTIAVRDTGIGMEEKYVRDIFSNFSQEDKSIARKYGGTGLGMSICRQLVELMNGSIKVESKKGKGTTVTIKIPLSVGLSKDCIHKTHSPQPSMHTLKDRTVLLVEDNEINRLVAVTILNGHGLRITEAENGEIALNLLKTHQFDAILMDMQMPVMDGLKATRVIRDEMKNSTPIIALTANAISGESDKCRNAGMNDFLSKPFEEADLIGKLQHWICNTEVIESPSTGRSDKQKPTKLFDLSPLEKIAHGDQKFVDKMIGLFIDTIPPAIQEMQQAFESSDLPKVRGIAHKIKPALDNVGIASLHQPIRQIEAQASAGYAESLPGLIELCRETVDKVVSEMRSCHVLHPAITHTA